MKNKVLVMIAIIEAIILVLVSGYRIYEYFYMNKSGDVNIPNNEVIENKKDEIIVDLPSFEDDFYKAEYVYSWFYGFNSIKITSKEKIDNYYRVKVDGLNSKSDLEKLLNTLFSEEIANELLNKKIEDDYLFKDIDGALYVYGGYVSEYSYNEVNRTIFKEEVSSDKTIYNVSITSENGINNCNTTYTYNYEKNSDGKLVFTNFEVPVSVCYNLIDKENTDNDDINNDNTDEDNDKELESIEEFDLIAAKNLIDKYYYRIDNNDIFTNGFNDESKMIITLNNIPNDDVVKGYDCDSIFENDESSVFKSYYYEISLNDFNENKSAFCPLTTGQSDYLSVISYETANKLYKELFGYDEEMSKKSSGKAKYYFKNNNFYELSCNVKVTYALCTNIEEHLKKIIYGVKSAYKLNGKLYVDVVLETLTCEEIMVGSCITYNSKVANRSFEADYFVEQKNNQKFIDEYKNSMELYEFVFEESEGNYFLKNMVKK